MPGISIPTNSGFDTSKLVKNMMLSSGLGGIGSGLASTFFGNDDSPYDAASSYFDKIPQELNRYYEPYVNAGRDTLGDLSDQYDSILKDPGSLITRLSEGFKSSPGYNFEKNEGLNAINNAAAAGGMLGTASHQEDSANLASNFANKDFQDYLKQVLSLWGTGLQGKEGINKTGYDASSNMAQNIAQALMSQGNLAFSGQAAQNQNNSSGISDILGGASALLPLLMA